MEYRRRRRRSDLGIALWLIVPALLIAAGIAANLGELALVIAFFGGPGLIYGVYALARSRKYRRGMRELRVDGDAVLRFEREYRLGDRKRFGKVVLTDNWLLSYTLSATCLLPLREAAWIYGATEERNNPQTGTVKVHYVKVHFRNGIALKVACDKLNFGSATHAFAQRCPQALFGFYDGREREWKEEAKRWRGQ
jgi:hypothetical protein